MQKGFDAYCSSEATFFNFAAAVLIDKASAIFDKV